jgi:hypothetical protein
VTAQYATTLPLPHWSAQAAASDAGTLGASPLIDHCYLQDEKQRSPAR